MSRRTVWRTAKGCSLFQLVEPAALSLVGFPQVCSFRLPSSWPPQADAIPLRGPSLPRHYPASTLLWSLWLLPGYCLRPDRSLCFMCMAFRSFRLQPP